MGESKKENVILIVDLGGENVLQIESIVREIGIVSHTVAPDVTESQLVQFGNIKGFVLLGGVRDGMDGESLELSSCAYDLGLPVLRVNHKSAPPLPTDLAQCKGILENFFQDGCGIRKKRKIKFKRFV